MTDVTFPEGDESILRKYKDNGDGSYTEYVETGVSETSIASSTTDVHAPTSNTAAVVTYTPVVAKYNCISGIAWSYEGTNDPTNGNLKVEDGATGTVVFSMDITAKGAGFIPFPKYKRNAVVNSALIITLAAGGSGVTGKVSVLNHWTE